MTRAILRKIVLFTVLWLERLLIKQKALLTQGYGRFE